MHSQSIGNASRSVPWACISARRDAPRKRSTEAPRFIAQSPALVSKNVLAEHSRQCAVSFHSEASNTFESAISSTTRGGDHQQWDSAASSDTTPAAARLAVAICSCAAALSPLLISGFPANASTDLPPSAAAAPANPIAEVSGLFGLGGANNEDDPVDPFTLYGAVYKKYVIEVLEGEDVVARKRGFTVTTCASTMPASAETPAFNSLPIGERVFQGGPYLCIKRESKELEEACSSACDTACDQQLSNYDKAVTENSGFSLSEKLKGKVLKSGKRQCNYECNKQGKFSSFVVPARNF